MCLVDTICERPSDNRMANRALDERVLRTSFSISVFRYSQ